MCGGCPGTLRCRDKPSADSPAAMECVACSGVGCDECNERGTIEFVGCPLEIVPEDVWEFVKYAELFEKGLPPVAGGALDQAKNFIDACDFYLNEVQVVKNKQGNFDYGF